MLKWWTVRLLAAALLTLGVAACDDDIPTSPIPTPNPVTETFRGSITQNGVSIQSFPTASLGNVIATLKEVSPDAALVVGFSLGNWNGTACQVVLDNPAATGGAVLAGNSSGVGSLCLRMYDVGNITTTPAAYVVEITHP
jgi:hypothetical protein